MMPAAYTGTCRFVSSPWFCFAYRSPVPSTWHPEYGSWMVEATPGAPYGEHTDDLRRVELSMAVR